MADKQGYLLPTPIDPLDYVCILIHAPNDPRHLAALWGQLSELGKWQTWERDADHNGTLAAQLWRRVYYEARDLFESTGGACMFCCDETNALLRELIDCCKAQSAGVSMQLTLSRFEVVNNYWSDPSSIHYDAPDTTFTAGSGDTPEMAEQRYNALCWAVTEYTNTIIEQVRQQAVAAGVVAAGGALLLSPLAGGIAALVSGVVIAGLDAGVFSNADAQKEVRCCMFSHLYGATLSYDNFAAAVADCSFEALTAEAQLAYLVHNSSQDRANYLEFVRLLGLGMTVGVDATECDCTEPGQDWIHHFYMTTGAHGWVQESGYDPAQFTSNGVTGGGQIPSNHNLLLNSPEVGAFNMTGIVINYHVESAQYGSNSFSNYIDNGWINPSPNGWNSWETYDGTCSYIPESPITIYGSGNLKVGQWYNSDDTAHCWITEIIISGTGTDPF